MNERTEGRYQELRREMHSSLRNYEEKLEQARGSVRNIQAIREKGVCLEDTRKVCELVDKAYSEFFGIYQEGIKLLRSAMRANKMLPEYFPNTFLTELNDTMSDLSESLEKIAEMSVDLKTEGEQK